MNRLHFTIPRTLVLEILHHIQTQPDKEVCGLVGGDEKRARSYYPVDNIDRFMANRFTMDETGQIAAMKTMRSKNEELAAIFHSHPNGTAEPSVLDEVLGDYPEVITLIGATGTRGVLELRGYRQTESGGINEVELLMGEE
ncbi:MAG: Mov34/MPN/PAD-1 family protein [Methylococcaceae bacterium]